MLRLDCVLPSLGGRDLQGTVDSSVGIASLSRKYSLGERVLCHRCSVRNLIKVSAVPVAYTWRGKNGDCMTIRLVAQRGKLAPQATSLVWSLHTVELCSRYSHVVNATFPRLTFDLLVRIALCLLHLEFARCSRHIACGRTNLATSPCSSSSTR